MNNKQLLTSTASVLELTGLDQNLSGTYLLPAIKTTQETEVEQTIGSKLLNHLCNLVSTGAIDLPENAEFKTLIDDYLSGYIAFATVTALIPVVAYKINNAGVNRTEDDKMTGASKTEVNALKDYYQGRADYYKGRVQRYILSSSAFAPYLSADTLAQLKPNLHASDSCSIFLGGARGRYL